MMKDGFKIVGTKYLEPVYNIKDLGDGCVSYENEKGNLS